ncbi:MAG: alpha/beta fold hydrolase [Candidatus Hodarchaeales archaeon]
MVKAKVNNIQIEYETFGDPSSKPLLLVMGLGAQMVSWELDWCEGLANRGLFVIRFDNRDVGLSTKFEEAGIPDLIELRAAVDRGEIVDVPYSLEDMADDAIGVLDALNIDEAHICGSSMGGMIAQIIAYRYPSRVLSLSSLMSSTGNPDLPRLSQSLLIELSKPYPSERNAYIEERIRRIGMYYGTFPFDIEQARMRVARDYDRCYYPQGRIRQNAAIIASENRKPKLALIKVPTLVVHGKEDPLVPVEAGIDTAEVIPGAELLILERMGHSRPPEIKFQIMDAIIANINKVNS